MLNTGLLKHPINWLTVWSMALLAFFVGHLLISYFRGVHPGNPQQLPAPAGGGVTGPGTVDTPNSATNDI